MQLTLHQSIVSRLACAGSFCAQELFACTFSKVSHSLWKMRTWFPEIIDASGATRYIPDRRPKVSEQTFPSSCLILGYHHSTLTYAVAKFSGGSIRMIYGALEAVDDRACQ